MSQVVQRDRVLAGEAVAWPQPDQERLCAEHLVGYPLRGGNEAAGYGHVNAAGDEGVGHRGQPHPLQVHDRADTMLAGLHARARQNSRASEATWPETDGPRITALARHDPETQTVTLVLDATTASIAMFALAAHADEREAHVREVERFGASLPEGSYGRRNRQAIAARETRVATRLRAIQHAYQAVAGHDTAFTPPEPARALRPPGHAADKEIELE